MYFTKSSLPLLISVLLLLPIGPATAQTAGTTDSEWGDLAPRAVGATVNPSFQFNGAAHVAGGVALRNATQGWIHLRGVPVGRRVLKAFLYWNLADASAAGSATRRATFNGFAVAGQKVADSPDACWGNVGNHTYRADVSRFIPKRRPNGIYEVVIQFDSQTSTSGQNPWTPFELQNVRLNGATLILVYQTSSGTVLIYDRLNNSMFSGSGSFTLNHSGLGGGRGLFTMTGGDGQRGAGHDNGASNETTSFGASGQIAGPPIAASDWDGSAGWPLVQLWDVHTHQVILDTNASTVTYTAGTDCLVPSAFALEVF